LYLQKKVQNKFRFGVLAAEKRFMRFILKVYEVYGGYGFPDSQPFLLVVIPEESLVVIPEESLTIHLLHSR